MPDTIIDEIRKTRDEYAKQFNYDLHQMCVDLRREQQLSGAQIVNFSPKSSDAMPVGDTGQIATNEAGR